MTRRLDQDRSAAAIARRVPREGARTNGAACDRGEPARGDVVEERHRDRAFRLRARARWLALAALLGACGGLDDEPVVYQHLELRAPTAPARDDRLLRTIAPPRDAAAARDWKLEAETLEFDPTGESLHLGGGDLHTIELPTELEAGRFDLVRLRLASANPISIQAGLLRDDRLLARTTDFSYVPGGELTEVELELVEARRKSGPPARLALSVKGEDLDWRLFAIELVRRPLEAWLPPPDAPAGLTLGLESRRAIGLSTRAPLEVDCRVPTEGRLAFDFTWPRQLAREGGVLTVEVVPERGESERWTYELDDEPRWTSAVSVLDAFAGRDVRLRFALQCDGDEPAICALTPPELYRPHPSPPTVLLVTSDTHRADHLATTDPSATLATPALDALAARGVRFADCFVTSNITLPSHAALFTGTHPRDTGVIDNSTALADAAPTLAEAFHDAGYYTLGVASAWHLRPSWSGFDQGFDRMAWAEGKNSVAGERVDVLRRALLMTHDKPLFVWLHLFDAHRPYSPPAPYDEAYWSADRDPYDAALPEPTFPSPPGMRGLRDLDYVLAQYKGEVAYLDSQLGTVLALPRFASAIVAFTADHGEGFGEHYVWWNHVGLYPEVLHVPLILAWPSAPAGTVVERPVRQIDVGRTLLNLADERERPFAGHDLLDPSANADGVRFGLSDTGEDASLNVGRWHLVIALRPRARPIETDPRPFELHRTELFDLRADPGCENDLSEREPERVRAMRSRLVDWLRASTGGAWGRSGEVSAEDSAFLGELGYAGGGEGGSELMPEHCACPVCERYR